MSTTSRGRGPAWTARVVLPDHSRAWTSVDDQGEVRRPDPSNGRARRTAAYRLREAGNPSVRMEPEALQHASCTMATSRLSRWSGAWPPSRRTSRCVGPSVRPPPGFRGRARAVRGWSWPPPRVRHGEGAQLAGGREHLTRFSTASAAGPVRASASSLQGRALKLARGSSLQGRRNGASPSGEQFSAQVRADLTDAEAIFDPLQRGARGYRIGSAGIRRLNDRVWNQDQHFLRSATAAEPFRHRHRRHFPSCGLNDPQ